MTTFVQGDWKSVTERISAFIAKVIAKDMEQISSADNTTVM